MIRYFVLFVFLIPIFSCASLREWASSPEGQEALTVTSQTAGRWISGFLGLPPGVGEAGGFMLMSGVLSLFGVKTQK